MVQATDMQVSQAAGVDVMQATDVHVIRYLLSLICHAVHVILST